MATAKQAKKLAKIIIFVLDTGACPSLANIGIDATDLIYPKERYLPPPLKELLSSPEERILLEQSAYVRELKRGDRFIIEGEAIEDLNFLIEGKVKVCRNGMLGQSHIIKMIPPGHFMGLRTFFAGTIARASAIACGHTRILTIPRATLYELLERNPKLGLFFLRTIAHELDSQETRTLTLQQKHLRGRLADSLLMLAEYYGYEDDGATLEAQLSRADLASLSNMTMSNASRTLSTFASERIIALSGRRITIIDPMALKQAARQG